MARVLFFFLSLFSVLSLLGQRNCDSILPFLGHPEKELPIFDKSAENDFGKLLFFINSNIVYPTTAKEEKIEGLVTVGFKIEITGATSEHKIIQGVREDLDNEALRVAKLIKFAKPAMDYNNKPVPTCYRLTFAFYLNDKKILQNNSKQSFKTKRKQKY